MCVHDLGTSLIRGLGLFNMDAADVSARVSHTHIYVHVPSKCASIGGGKAAVNAMCAQWACHVAWPFGLKLKRAARRANGRQPGGLMDFNRVFINAPVVVSFLATCSCSCPEPSTSWAAAGFHVLLGVGLTLFGVRSFRFLSVFGTSASGVTLSPPVSGLSRWRVNHGAMPCCRRRVSGRSRPPRTRLRPRCVGR